MTHKEARRRLGSRAMRRAGTKNPRSRSGQLKVLKTRPATIVAFMVKFGRKP